MLFISFVPVREQQKLRFFPHLRQAESLLPANLPMCPQDKLAPASVHMRTRIKPTFSACENAWKNAWRFFCVCVVAVAVAVVADFHHACGIFSYGSYFGCFHQTKQIREPFLRIYITQILFLFPK